MPWDWNRLELTMEVEERYVSCRAVSSHEHRVEDVLIDQITLMSTIPCFN